MADQHPDPQELFLSGRNHHCYAFLSNDADQNPASLGKKHLTMPDSSVDLERKATRPQIASESPIPLGGWKGLARGNRSGAGLGTASIKELDETSLLEQTRSLAVALLSRRGGAAKVSGLLSILSQPTQNARLVPDDAETAWTLLGSVVVDALIELRQMGPAISVSTAISSRLPQTPSAVLASRRTHLVCLLNATHDHRSRRAVLEAVAWLEPMILDQAIDELERARAALTVAHAWSALGRAESATAWLESAALLFERAGQPDWVTVIRQEIVDPPSPVSLLVSPPEAAHLAKDPTAWEGPLTPAEARVALVVGRGKSDRDAAAELYVSTRTVAFHLQSVFRKLGVKNRCELANLVGRSAA
jgi:DNA-binding CsgD family transcriptional regulator